MKFVLLTTVGLVVVITVIIFWVKAANDEMDHCQYLVVQKYMQPENDYIRKLAKKQISMAEFTRQDELYNSELTTCRDNASKKYLVPSSVLDRIRFEEMKSLGIQ